MTTLLPDGALSAVFRQLRSSQPFQRRTAAQALRRLKIGATGPALLDALRQEIREPASWEARYQMIMALGECGHAPALTLLRDLARGERSHRLLGVALGDAIVRLSVAHVHDAEPVLEFLDGTDHSLIEGALRAMAMTRMVPPEDVITRIVMFADQHATDDPVRLWVAAAAAGWSGKGVRGFLDRCRNSPREDIRKAAESSSKGKYLKWFPP